jgi:hypothetical protein
MEPTRAITVHFTDGSKVSFGFPNQAANAAARQIRLEEFLKSPYLWCSRRARPCFGGQHQGDTVSR